MQSINKKRKVLISYSKLREITLLSESPNAPEVKRHERCLQASGDSLLGYERQEENGGHRL